MRGLARTLRHLPDRLLHPRRRARALGAVSSARAEDRVLVLCLGNICRSPFAEARLKAAGGLGVRSRGLVGPGRPSPPEARQEALRHGVDLAAHVSETLTAEDVAWADLVIAMDGRQSRAAARLARVRSPRVLRLGDLDPEPIQRRAIVDPFGKGEAAFRECFARIARCLAPLEARLRATGEPPGGGG